MQEFNNYTILLLPFYLVAILIVWSLWKKTKWLGSSLLSLSFSSIALIFFLVHNQSINYGNFEVGFIIGMYASLAGTIPLAGFGWYLGKKTNLRVAVLIAIAGVSFNFLAAYTYQYKIKKMLKR